MMTRLINFEYVASSVKFGNQSCNVFNRVYIVIVPTDSNFHVQCRKWNASLWLKTFAFRREVNEWSWKSFCQLVMQVVRRCGSICDLNIQIYLRHIAFSVHCNVLNLYYLCLCNSIRNSKTFSGIKKTC